MRPFRALRPEQGAAEKIASVPYDVVDTEEAKKLAQGNDLSFLHVIRPEIDLPEGTDLYDDSVYEQAKINFNKLVSAGKLIQEDGPALYLYRLSADGREQIGIAGCSSVDEYDNGTIKKHEYTRKAKEDDRVRHMLTLSAHAGPVLLTCRRTEKLHNLMQNEMERKPLFDFTAVDGVRHTIWRCIDSPAVEEAFKEVPALYIADGHHRAAGAGRVKQEMVRQGKPVTGSEEFNYFLTVSFPSDQLNIFAYNRYISDLGGKTEDQFLTEVKKVFTVSESGKTDPSRKGEICMYLGGSWYTLIVAKSGEETDPVSALDLSQFQKKLLEPVLGIMDQRKDDRIDFIGGEGSSAKLQERVDARGGCAFTFYPVSVEELLAVADAEMIMPPKSTWFAPKLRSGLLIHQF
jgi:uncharacterized protein (DUF1015 family)